MNRKLIIESTPNPGTEHLHRIFSGMRLDDWCGYTMLCEEEEPVFTGMDLARQCRNCVKAEDSFIDYEVGDRIEKCTDGILFCTEKSIKVPAGWDECKDGFEAIEAASEEPEVKSATHCEACGCARRFYLYGRNSVAIEESNSVLPASKPSAVWKDHERYCVRHMRIVPALQQGCGHFAAINTPDQCEDEPTPDLEVQEKLPPERFARCIINHMLESVANWAGDDADNDQGDRDQDEICADLAKQNQQLQKRVDELEKCLAAQEEQIDDYVKELNDLEVCHTGLKLYCLVEANTDKLHPDDEFFDYQAEVWRPCKDLKNTYRQSVDDTAHPPLYMIQGRPARIRRKIRFTSSL